MYVYGTSRKNLYKNFLFEVVSQKCLGNFLKVPEVV